jgi:RecA/RadA recombinase
MWMVYSFSQQARARSALACRHGAQTVMPAVTLLRPARSTVPTSFPALEAVLLDGGVPRGTLTTLTSMPSSGGTSLGLAMLAQAQ